ncbi:MAG: VCBS repeat-containing protein [Cyclobacteriaceae bacterium]|nr:VCBS repeat-containing protein [Cyclobacteriaceae bacterium SS2]
MRFYQILIVLIAWIICSCGEKSGREKKQYPETSSLTGDVLAIQHCSSCHALVPPSMLPRSIWQDDVLPSMGYRLGMYRGDHQPDSLFDEGIGGEIARKAEVYPEQPQISEEDWQKIKAYYLDNAPEEIAPPKREKKIAIGLKHFNVKASEFTHRPPLTSMIKILDNNRGFAIGDGKRDFSNLTFLNTETDQDFNTRLKTSPIHFYEKGDTVYLTTVGQSLYPHDAPDGNILKLYRKAAGEPFRSAKELISGLQRPVHVSYGDLDNDGQEDLVVCEYGNLTGMLSWFRNQGGRYQKKVLRNKPGAIKTELVDFDKDGSMDILTLMAQGDEGLFWYRNSGKGSFEEVRLLSFLPLNGSQYFELHDFDGDGDLDILYVCGDNADQTPILKDYHGIYIYLNDGSHQFEQKYFYPLNGAYKAMARDYDLDGDLDIAAISFFPDYARHPEESFVYLENKGLFEYDDYSFENASQGRWIVMDAADMDADGDIDIALGSFVAFIAAGDTTGLGQRWIRQGPSMVVLENTVR